MNETQFQRELSRARTLATVEHERSAWWEGYQRGLRRAYHGERFGTDAEHQLWLGLVAETRDEARRQRGLGYRHGLHCGSDAPLTLAIRTQPSAYCEDPRGRTETWTVDASAHLEGEIHVGRWNAADSCLYGVREVWSRLDTDAAIAYVEALNKALDAQKAEV